MVLLALSAAIYGMVAFGMSKTYLSELNRSIEEEMNSMIAQFKEMPDEGVKNMLSRFAVEYGVSINLQDEDGNEIETYGDISYSLSLLTLHFLCIYAMSNPNSDSHLLRFYPHQY